MIKCILKINVLIFYKQRMMGMGNMDRFIFKEMWLYTYQYQVVRSQYDDGIDGSPVKHKQNEAASITFCVPHRESNEW